MVRAFPRPSPCSPPICKLFPVVFVRRAVGRRNGGPLRTCSLNIAPTRAVLVVMASPVENRQIWAFMSIRALECMTRQKRADLPSLGPGEGLWEPNPGSLFRILGRQFRSQDHAAGASAPAPLVIPRAAAASIIAAALLLMTAGECQRRDSPRAGRTGLEGWAPLDVHPEDRDGVRTVRTRVSRPHTPQR